jgi:cell division transport system permease protein
LVAAIAFLATLAITGWVDADAQIGFWEDGAGSSLTVQVPRADDPDATGSGTRLCAVRALLVATPGIGAVNVISEDEVNGLLLPWVGTKMDDLPIPFPAILAVRIVGALADLARLEAMMSERAPGTFVEDHAAWTGRLVIVGHSLRSCSSLVLLILVFVTAAVIAVLTRSGLTSRRDVIMIVHQLGASDDYIAHRFADRAARLAAIGGLFGALFALPVVFALTALATPLGDRGAPAPATAISTFRIFHLLLWLLPLFLPAATATIGYFTAQITMRQWLRHLPARQSGE